MSAKRISKVSGLISRMPSEVMSSPLARSLSGGMAWFPGALGHDAEARRR